MGLIFLAYASLLCFGLVDTFRGPYFSQIINDFSLGENSGAAFFALTSIMISWCSGRGSGWLHRMGARGLLNLSSLMMALGFFIISAASSVVLLYLGSVVLGSGMGFATLAQNVTIMERSPAHSRSRWLSGLHTMYSLAAILAPAISHWMLERGWSWRFSFRLIAGLPLILFFVGLISDKGKILVAKNEGHTQQNLVLPKGFKFHMILVAVVVSLYLLAEISIGTRLVRYLEVARQLPPAQGSLWLMGFFSGLCLGRIFALLIPVREKYTVTVLLSILFLGIVSISAGLIYSPWGMVVGGAVLGPFYPLSIAYIRQRFSFFAPTALSYMLGLGSLFVVLMHFAIGFIANAMSLSIAMWIGPVGLILSSFLLIFEYKPKLFNSAVPLIFLVVISFGLISCSVKDEKMQGRNSEERQKKLNTKNRLGSSQMLNYVFFRMGEVKQWIDLSLNSDLGPKNKASAKPDDCKLDVNLLKQPSLENKQIDISLKGCPLKNAEPTIPTKINMNTSIQVSFNRENKLNSLSLEGNDPFFLDLELNEGENKGSQLSLREIRSLKLIRLSPSTDPILTTGPSSGASQNSPRRDLWRFTYKVELLGSQKLVSAEEISYDNNLRNVVLIEGTLALEQEKKVVDLHMDSLKMEYVSPRELQQNDRRSGQEPKKIFQRVQMVLTEGKFSYPEDGCFMPQGSLRIEQYKSSLYRDSLKQVAVQLTSEGFKLEGGGLERTWGLPCNLTEEMTDTNDGNVPGPEVVSYEPWDSRVPYLELFFK